MEVLAIGSFVDSPQNYADLIDFWKHTFTSLTGLAEESYVNNTYGNGKAILDGNPIFISKITADKGIRIIQAEPDMEQPLLSSWIHQTVIHDKPFEELVIALQLNSETYTETIQLIKLYADEVLTPKILQGINEKYEG
ncbi:hypothetical protein [Pedobacter hartonius]|uniref:Uncharacterized protein n=1 Tax=Pedobacter hartonius TaxID=425514 RepID=A0A1H4EM54_9SPHI|nr:hypothetical protein [Pedobacter hartonius]SEA86125.1 hypothetical protein SAMN05443550_10651 [Pedobacter hartonius]